MSSVQSWGRVSDHPLDFASADSAMGHAADLALGIAMAQRSRSVWCLNGDGSMLMSLGTLVTIVESGVQNLVLFVMNNGSYEITGGQPLPGAGQTGFAALATAAGFGSVHRFEEAREYEENLDAVLNGGGPTFVELKVELGSEGPISRGAHQQATYLKTSLFDSARSVRRALLSLEDELTKETLQRRGDRA
jgi:thiamine pyrophosphate-dependent acetolactate synthase large subunit-like protein